MSDYADLCEMYGREPGDPNFIDDLIEEISKESELEWLYESDNKTHHDILTENLKSVKALCDLECPIGAKFSLFVMLHGHLVSAVEGYLAGVFINKVTSSEVLIKKLVENDPEFSKRTFTMKDIFQKHSSIKDTVAIYLKNLIFHDLKKVKPMYKSVLDHDFGDISWLFNAVELRHHCVHRAGYDKNGNKISVNKTSILELLSNIKSVAKKVEATINNL